MKKLINKMATPIFSKITMTTRMGAEPWKRKRRRGVRRCVESLSKAALEQGWELCWAQDTAGQADPKWPIYTLKQMIPQCLEPLLNFSMRKV